ncbi:hypothetical protein [Candidatus Azoamicus ciliaticola]|uniref:Uncharacterized protein n=1 Tax=Candidatus Azoamicus ciliaticola TaxID=2652803 RepID=A0A6J5JYH1_9GAMM|nr:hypothetical protein [Candidatus Azoamicus ciliaticola]CAB3976393.1 Uncharacterised protein [Candidatus Azoamicus ciliaticola]
MINKIFRTIKFYFYKNNLPRIISIYNLNKNDFFKIKNIAIWLMCTKKKEFICKKCKSCIRFKKNINYDYFELVNNEIFILEKFIKNKPIFSNIKVVFLFLNNKSKNIIKFLENNVENNNTYFLLFLNNKNLKINNLSLIFYVKNKVNLISIKVIKFIYYKFLNKKFSFKPTNFLNIDKVIIIDSLIFFFKIYLYNFSLKKNRILINNEIKKKLIKKNTFFILNVLEKYKKNTFKNNNLNIFLLINFIIEYINA